jgi:putative ABC transport system permease protein
MRYSGILRIGFKLLVNDRGKFFALLIGITFAVFLMMEMTAMFAGILNRAFSPVTNIGAAMWIMDPAVNTATSPIPMPDYVLDAARSMDGVSYAVPLFMGGALVKLASGAYQGVNVVGLDDSSLFGRPELEQGNIQDIYADNTFFVVDDAEISKLGNPKIGTTFELNDHRGTIVGIARVVSNGLNGVPTLYTTYNRAIEYLPFDAFHHVLCSGAAEERRGRGRHQEQVAKLGYVAFTKDEFNNQISTTTLYQTGIGTNILLMTIIAFIVGLSISGQTFTPSSSKTWKNLARLKAIGAKGRELIYMILFMAFFTAMIGYGLGIGLVTLMITIAKSDCPITRRRSRSGTWGWPSAWSC